MIVIDIPSRVLAVDLPDSELGERASAWQSPDRPPTGGFLDIYASFADSAARGATLRPRDTSEGEAHGLRESAR